MFMDTNIILPTQYNLHLNNRCSQQPVQHHVVCFTEMLTPNINTFNIHIGKLYPSNL